MTKTKQAVVTIGSLAVIAGSVVMVLPQVIKPRLHYSTSACFNNLRNIDKAKNEWATDHGKHNGDAVDQDAINRLIGKAPVCPDWGTYSYNVIGSNPTCTVTSPVMHRLSPQERAPN